MVPDVVPVALFELACLPSEIHPIASALPEPQENPTKVHDSAVVVFMFKAPSDSPELRPT